MADAKPSIPAQVPDKDEATQRLPQLREPLGWRSLDEQELAVRASLLLDAAMAPPTAQSFASIPASDQAWLKMPIGHATSPVEVLDSAERNGLSHGVAEAVRDWGRLAVALPWLVGLLGLVVSAPVLVWAPLLGGLCLGLVGFQVVLTRGWIQRRQVLQVEVDLPRVPHARLADASRKTSAGVLLAALLMVFGSLVVIVIYTAALHKRESVSAGEILRAQHPKTTGEPEPADKDTPVSPTMKSP